MSDREGNETCESLPKHAPDTRTLRDPCTQAHPYAPGRPRDALQRRRRDVLLHRTRRRTEGENDDPTHVVDRTHRQVDRLGEVGIDDLVVSPNTQVAWYPTGPVTTILDGYDLDGSEPPPLTTPRPPSPERRGPTTRRHSTHRSRLRSSTPTPPPTVRASTEPKRRSGRVTGRASSRGRRSG